jgi:hypothetical protein
MAVINSPEFQSAYPRKYPEIPFRAIDGFIDFLLPSIPVGSSGAISGLPNIAPVSPLSITEIYNFLTNHVRRKSVSNYGKYVKTFMILANTRRHKSYKTSSPWRTALR